MKTLHALCRSLDFIPKNMEDNWGTLRKIILETSLYCGKAIAWDKTEDKEMT